MNIFICTECGAKLEGFFPEKCNCGFQVPIVNGVYQFTDDKPISTESDSLQWLGYEYVGENYEPAYFHDKASDTFGDCRNLAAFLGEGKIVLDIGAGLGVSAISMALSGLQVIAVDISQVMLESAQERAQRHNAAGIIFTRMNGYRLALADNSVDAVLEVDMLRQVNQPELVISEIKRVLKPDGFLLQYGSMSSLGYTKAQETDNAAYNTALNDIQTHYDNLLQEAGYGNDLFSSSQQAENCIKENFAPVKTTENTGAYIVNNRKWLLKWGLHKLKTRASGVKQFMPDEIHDTAWAKTHEYAIGKYGENYENIARWVNHASSIVVMAQI